MRTPPRKLTEIERADILAATVANAAEQYRVGYESEQTEIARELVAFRPEFGFSKELCKFLSDEDVRNGYGRSDPDEFQDFPFFCEAVLYSLFGKEDARTLLALLRQGLGMTHEEFGVAQNAGAPA